MEIQALPAPFDPSKDSYSNLKSYTDTTLPNMVSSQTTLSGVPAMQVDDMRVFSMPNLDATIDTHSVQSSNIVGYKKFKDFFIWGHGSLFKISYFDGDSSIFDPIVQTFILKDTPNGKDETQQ